MVIEAKTPLVGAPPAEVFEPIPREDLVRAMTEEIPELLSDLEGDEANVLLTLVRIWSTLETGEFRSKDAAADWALQRVPEEHRPALARARAVYVGGEDDRWDDLEGARRHADFVAAEIDRLRAESA